jgi:hypothetical protein
MKLTILFLVAQFFSCSQSYVKSYKDLESAFTDWYFKFHPVQSTFYGSDEYNFFFKRLDNDSREEYLADIQRFHIEISQIDETKLPKTEYINYSVLNQFLARQIYFMKFERKYEWDVSLYPKMVYDGIVSLVDLDYLNMNDRTHALERRLEVSTNVLDIAYQNLKFYSDYHQKKTFKIIDALNKLLEELPTKIMSDNQTLDRIDIHIRNLKRELKSYKDWIAEDYSHFEKFEVKNTPSELKSFFTHIIGEEYAISKVSQLAERRINRIYNQLFNISLPFYLQKNDEPIWVDRDDSLSVIHWVMHDISSNEINSEEYISSIYSASKRVQDGLERNRDILITPIPNIQIRFDDEYSLSSTFARVGGFQLNNDNRNLEYLVKPLTLDTKTQPRLNHYELDLMVMKDLYPGSLQLQESMREKSELIRQIIQNNVTNYGWQHYITSYMIDSGYGGGENYAYELTYLYESLKIAGLSWMEMQICYHELEVSQVINELVEKINISKMEAKGFIENINRDSFHYTKQFIGAIEMERLLADYKRNNQNRLDMREFHSKILNEGSVSISQLRKIILN